MTGNVKCVIMCECKPLIGQRSIQCKIVRILPIPKRRAILRGSHVLFQIYYTASNIYTVADPGGAAGARPPYGSRFFRFDTQIFRNVDASGVGAPPTRSAPPLQEILDPLLIHAFW